MQRSVASRCCFWAKMALVALALALPGLAMGQPVRIKVLRCALAGGRGAPGEVIDDDLTIACGDGAIRIAQLQRAGKQPMTAEDFLRGTPIAKGMAMPAASRPRNTTRTMKTSRPAVALPSWAASPASSRCPTPGR